jgi:hypothetical protein
MHRKTTAIPLTSCLLLFFAILGGSQDYERNSLPDNSDSKQGYNRLQMPAATAEQIAAHPWLVDPTLAEKVSALSPELGQIIAIEQKELKAHWAPEFRQGAAVLVPGDAKTSYRFELIMHKAADEYRIKRDADNAEKRIVLGRDMWVISSGDDYSQFVGSGRIAHADQRNAPEHSDSGKTYNLAQLPPATAEQIAAHPWLTDTTLPQKVSALSPELGDIITSEQKNLKLHWGTEFSWRGHRTARPKQPKNGLQVGADHA